MSAAIESIIACYVKLNNVDALNELVAHRTMLLNQLGTASDSDAIKIRTEIEQEIAAVQAALLQLGPRSIVLGSQDAVIRNDSPIKTDVFEDDVSRSLAKSIPLHDLSATSQSVERPLAKPQESPSEGNLDSDDLVNYLISSKR